MYIFQNAVVRNHVLKEHFVKDEEPYKASSRAGRAVTQRKPISKNPPKKGKKERKTEKEER